MGMHYYSFGTALYQRVVGKQLRLFKEILSLGVGFFIIYSVLAFSLEKVTEEKENLAKENRHSSCIVPPPPRYL